MSAVLFFLGIPVWIVLNVLGVVLQGIGLLGNICDNAADWLEEKLGY